MEKIKIKLTSDQLITVESLLKKAPCSDKTMQEKTTKSILLQVLRNMSKRAVNRYGKSGAKDIFKFNFEYYEAYHLQEFLLENYTFFSDVYMIHQIQKTIDDINKKLQ